MYKYKIIFLVFFWVISIVLFSCQQKIKHGDFTILYQKDKYEALGGAIKIDGHTLQYKGNEIDWSTINPDMDNPNVERFEFLDSNNKSLLAEVWSNYYLLIPDGEKVKIKFLATASTSSGVFDSKPFTELLKNNLLFHQAGMLLNLQSFKKDTLAFMPGGRFLATNEDVSKIIYLNGVFEDDTNLKKTLDNAQAYAQTGVYNFDSPTDYSTITVLEWDVKNNQQYQYSYSDTTLWNSVNKYYDDRSHLALSTYFDSSTVFNLFKWTKDSIGVTHLIPKNISSAAITFDKLKADGTPEKIKY
jgi:hypothetical protein